LGLCHLGGGGSVKRCGVFGNGDKVQFVELFGQVLCGGRLISYREGQIEIAHTCCSCCEAGDSVGKMFALCGECCLTGFSSEGFVGGV